MMKLKDHRWISRLSVLVTGTLLLTACAGGAAEEAPAGGRESFEGTNLRVLLKEGYEIEAIQEFKGEFEEATGITVDLEVYDEPTARQKLVLDATSGTGTYDITSSSFWNLPEFVSAGWLQPLDEYVAQAKDDWLVMEDIPQGAIESMTIDDQLYALPHTIIGGMFFYRKDVFDELGLQPPQTTEEILAAAKVIKEERPELIPFTARGASNFASLGTELGWAYGYGAELFDENGNPQANTPEMEEAMTDFVTLMQEYGPGDAATQTFTQAGEKFSSGSAAMMFDTSGFGTIFEDPTQSSVAGKVGYTLPTGPSGDHLQWLYNEGLAITADSKNKNAAWLFLQWRMSRDITTKEVTELHRTDVPNLHVLESETYRDFMAEQGLEEFSGVLQDSWEMTTAEHWPFYPEFTAIGDTFAKEISAAIAGSKSVPDALETAQNELTQIMTDAGHIQ
ncbi:ABC transporter substrate-binding protein [uncultured Arthrobacter sp.]|uniref:ABC transporter substrate-binding protein n=1 Tax=uncultured Arthrobacter sp. TaxID=114050 RepID=UPI0026248401|nr:sugar ABC transporter substrate-binding protein [uncultured Arthrobacter sp.]